MSACFYFFADFSSDTRHVVLRLRSKATNTVGLSLDGTDLSFGFYYNF